jgi:hypothetical protein
MLEIINWNIAPNRDWFVRLSDNGTGITAELYLSAADASAQTNRQASGSTTGYGSSLDITLTNDEGVAYQASEFQAEYAWHLQVSGQAGNTAKTYKVREFVELPEISAAIYRSQDLIARRATAEINAHTHASIIRVAELGVHLPDADIGQIAQITSTSRGIDALGQIDHMVIEGYVDESGEASLTNTIEVIEYQELTR